MRVALPDGMPRASPAVLLERGAFDAWYRRKAGEKAVVKVHDGRRVSIPLSGQSVTPRQHISGIEALVYMKQAIECADHEPGADQQHQRYAGQFTDDESRLHSVNSELEPPARSRRASPQSMALLCRKSRAIAGKLQATPARSEMANE